MDQPQQAFNRLKNCRHGTMLYNIHDMYIGRSLDLYGEFSEGEVDLFRQIVRPGDVVFDIGANIGVHTVYFARAVGVQGAVFAFEPQRLIFQTLCANIALNSLTNVHCFQMALGEAPGMVNVPLLSPWQTNNFGGLGLGSYSAGEPVQVVRLDALGVRSCRMLKIDVEGMELQVLKGATGLIRQFAPVLYVENDRAEKAAELIRFIDSMGYHMFWHSPPLYNPKNFLNNAQNVFDRIISANMLCMKAGSYTGDPGLPKVEVPQAPEAGAPASPFAQ